MKVTIQMSDELWENLEHCAKQANRRPEHYIVQQLEKFKDDVPGTRTLLLAEEERQALEDALDTGCPDGPRLLEAVRRACRLRVGDWVYYPSPGQLVALEQLARARGVTEGQGVVEYIDQTFRRVLEYMVPQLTQVDNRSSCTLERFTKDELIFWLRRLPEGRREHLQEVLQPKSAAQALKEKKGRRG